MVISPKAHNDGREVELLALDGTIPVSIRGKTENPIFTSFSNIINNIYNQ